jgi:hypothetical protein
LDGHLLTVFSQKSLAKGAAIFFLSFANGFLAKTVSKGCCELFLKIFLTIFANKPLAKGFYFFLNFF